ncbi:MAG: hypothetical protein KU29_06585 [Sulfurovum sp. FS06-10]|nr:MAG: hypothetical protein KU29_06585 [Sulfurovum sp. FS06-10]
MFGFIKMIQKWIAKLQSNKRMWFTTIFVIASGGILLSTYLLISTTERVAQNVYVNQTKEYELRLKSLEKLIEKKLHQVAIAFSQNNALIEAIQANDTVTLDQIANQFNTLLTEQNNSSLNIKFYSIQKQNEIIRNSIIAAIQTKNNIFGPEVIHDGIFYFFISPIIKDNQVIGVIEVKESIYTLKESFNALKQEYIFLLDSKMLPNLSIQNREGLYLPLVKNFLLNNKVYDTKTQGYMSDIDNTSIQKILSGDHLVMPELYLNGVIIRDINGVDIGVTIMGQTRHLEGGFINIAQNMTSQVVMITLGLIVSLLLFLF